MQQCVRGWRVGGQLSHPFHTAVAALFSWPEGLHLHAKCTYFSYTQLSPQGVQLATSLPNHRAISASALSGPSLPWIRLRPTSRAKSNLMVPGAESEGLVAPSRERPTAGAFLPSLQETVKRGRVKVERRGEGEREQ